MEFFEVINTRRSVRKYTSDIVPDAVIEKALAAAVKAPNSSNLQAWEFYWVTSPGKKTKLIDACLFQGTAKSASHLIVAVSKLDTWKRNRDILLQQMENDAPVIKLVKDYYFKIIPFLYTQDPFGIFGFIKWSLLNTLGLFRPIFRGPNFKKDLQSVVTKSTALACENFMLAVTAQGFGTCPMEGFDQVRVKKLLGLGRKSEVVMVISVGAIDPAGIYGPQYRVDPNLVIFKV